MRARQLLLRVLRAGVCGTDLHIVSWDGWSASRIRPPVTLGHEFVGEIIERGAGVTAFEPGERVSCESHIVCGTCLSCRTGNAVLRADRILGWLPTVASPSTSRCWRPTWRAPANVRSRWRA